MTVAVVVAAAVLGGAYAAYASTRRELRAGVDQFLLNRLRMVDHDLITVIRDRPGRLHPPVSGVGSGPPIDPLEAGAGRLIDFDVIAQVVDAQGRLVVAHAEQPALPIPDSIPVPERGRRSRRAVAIQRQDLDIGEVEYRMLTATLASGHRVQIARSLEELNGVLAGLRIRLGLIAAMGTALAGIAAWLVARSAFAPVAALTAACERVASNSDLATPFPVPASGSGPEELGRLATSFNTMLVALSASRRQQRDLVADAGHELRTPLTAIRTNIDFLGRAPELAQPEREQVLAETRLEVDEISNLVEELVQLATDAPRDESVELVDLGELAEEVALRYRRRSGRALTVELTDPATIAGHPILLDRALSNLVDNALKFSPEAAPVEILVKGSRIEVGDRGPGLAPDERHRVFDRFYRSPAARSLPGSGLGLAIVAQIAGQHGGAASHSDRSGGGLVAILELPGAASSVAPSPRPLDQE